MSGILIILYIIFALGALVSAVGLCITQKTCWAWLAGILTVLMVFCNLGIDYLREPSIEEKRECNCICCEAEERK
jgi:hypothetical protein